MLRIHFTGEDLRNITVAEHTDPLWDVLLSLHTLQEKEGSLVFGEWRRRTLAALPASARLLMELARPWGYSPDFLTPGRGEADFATQVDRVLSTPRSALRADLATLANDTPPTPWTRDLADAKAPVLRKLGEAMAAYHRVALAPYQERMRAHTEADRERRARALLSGGVDRLLAELHPRARWEAPVLHIPVYAEQDLYLEGRGLVLVPSLFLRIQPITLLDADRPPVLVYPLRQQLGWLTPGLPEEGSGSPGGPSPLSGLLGRTRAAILESAVTPGTTTELAARAGVALPVVSRHASVLRAAGLLETRRAGQAVRHHVTGLGLALLNGRLPD
ncbi:ArsR/SmtB family transcription factor [Streptomyces poonensis]|uniref:Transcriptional regulator n=1 Tax=Streptomyces poonensis TaxID=68255 RepID=A0A918PBD0_9ACTN|nr:winged helix-turn-helix domain-containing protein [Streptomyces poonensis]GGY96417.1 transcriptional regulator [Streptomyces poonensis]GLJ88956.1 transcriptional regulator [Streptomyces poonensis]